MARSDPDTLNAPDVLTALAGRSRLMRGQSPTKAQFGEPSAAKLHLKPVVGFS